MSREARGAAVVVALFGLLLALHVRRRLEAGGEPVTSGATSEAVERAPPATGEAPASDAVAPATVEPPGSPSPGEGQAPSAGEGRSPSPGDGAAPGTAAPGPAPRAGLTLRGRVVDPAGRPVAGARVVCWEAAPREVTSGADGTFACEGILPGDCGPRWGQVDLEATSGDARGQRQGVVVGPDQPPVEVVLRPSTRLRVKVLSSGAAVHLRAVLHADGLAPRTEQVKGGELDLECHDGDWVDVMALAPGHAPRRFALRAPSPEVTVQLSRAGGGALRGRVVEHDGAPATRVRLRVSSGAEDAGAERGPAAAGVVEERPLGVVQGGGATRDDGTFTVDGLAEGARVRLVLVRDQEDLLRQGPGLSVAAVVGDEELLVTLPRPGAHRVRLRAVAAESGQPQRDAGVGPPWSCAPGDGPGALVIDLPGPGEYAVPVVAPGRLARRLKVALDREETRDLGDVALEVPATLRLTVRWPDAPVDAAWLTWTDPRGEPARDEAAFSSRGGPGPAIVLCAAGSRGFTLRARRPGGLRQVVTFEATVVAGQETPVEVDLTSAPLGRE